MLVFLRIVMLLAPIIAVLLWLRWRSKQHMDEATIQTEVKRLRIGIAVMVIAMLSAGIGLRFADSGTADTDTVYVPARVENGKVIPGQFVPKNKD